MNEQCLNEHDSFFTGTVPATLRCDAGQFDALWNLHPESFHEVRMLNKMVKTPRWQQAYERSYLYTGNINPALPMPGLLRPYLTWCQEVIDSRLNGVLVNWYDGQAGHYIGKHRDSTSGLVPDSPIVTISLGEQRVFRFRPLTGTGFVDHLLCDGSFLLIPFAVNQRWTHEVPKSKQYQARRISITLRCFA